MTTSTKTTVDGSTFGFMQRVAQTVGLLARAHDKIRQDVATGDDRLKQGLSRMSGFGGSIVNPQYVMEAERYAAVLDAYTNEAILRLRDTGIEGPEADEMWKALIQGAATRRNGFPLGDEWVYQNYTPRTEGEGR